MLIDDRLGSSGVGHAYFKHGMRTIWADRTHYPFDDRHPHA
jgi:hypothetical protein